MESINTSLISFGAALLVLVCTSLYFASDYLANQDVINSQIPGCRRLGLTDRTNMDDEYSSIHRGEEGSSACEVKALFVYPIKSCARIELSETDVVATGLRYDRQFCFAQLQSEEAERPEGELGVNYGWIHKWKFMTQRRFAQMSQIDTEIWLPDPTSSHYSSDLEWVKSKGCLVCKFAFTPDWEWTNLFTRESIWNIWTIIKAKLATRNLKAEPMLTFRLPIVPDRTRSAKYTRNVMHIWKDTPEAINVTSEIPEETLAKLKYYFGLSNPLGLFMADPVKRRDIFRNAPTKEEAGYQPGTGFADAYPLSIMGLASVQELASKIPGRPRNSLSALRFRANIYLTGPQPFAEDSWKIIRMGRLSYHVSCRTTRCQLPNVDQDTGVRDRQEPLQTLKKMRAYVDEGAGSNPCLGMQMVPLLIDETGSESLAIGDKVEVLETGKHFYVRMFQSGEKIISS